MLKAATLALVATTVSGLLGAAVAGERAAVEPTAPSFVREIGTAPSATVGGTVASVGGHGRFVLTDALGDTITIDAKHLGLAGLAPGQMITVTGPLHDGRLAAVHAIREDGSVTVTGKAHRTAEI